MTRDSAPSIAEARRRELGPPLRLYLDPLALLDALLVWLGAVVLCTIVPSCCATRRPFVVAVAAASSLWLTRRCGRCGLER